VVEHGHLAIEEVGRVPVEQLGEPGVDNMAMSVVASTRGLALMPAYARNLLPASVVSTSSWPRNQTH
jgi:hypothetical protein